MKFGTPYESGPDVVRTAQTSGGNSLNVAASRTLDRVDICLYGAGVRAGFVLTADEARTLASVLIAAADTCEGAPTTKEAAR